MELIRVGCQCRLVLLLLALVLISPPRALAQPTMDVLWPNDDGHSWRYVQTYDDWLIGEHTQNEARLYFDGTNTVPGGIVVQNLEVEVSDPPPGMKTPYRAGDPPPGADPFLRTLWKARPELRAGIEAKIAASSAEPDRTPPGYYQVLIGDAAYRKSNEDIAAYREDLVAVKSWLWLVSDLTIGNTFAIQLVPDLADDIWLHGTYAAWEAVTVPAGFFSGCLRVEYRIDYGESICTDEVGNESGGFRGETRGFIHYAPGVGPVNHYEEWIPFVEFLWGDCPEQGYLGVVFTSGTLELTGEEPTPIQPTTWGRMRASFR